ncbi:MAG: MFS transporter [Myxococcota bacterium]
MDDLPTGFWARRGLGRPELRAWALYDWANSGFVTTVISAVFPIYFAKVAAADLPSSTATARFATASTIALVLVAVSAPLLGAVADYAGVKKKLLLGFAWMGAASAAALALVSRGDWLLGAVLFIVGNVGLGGSFVFYDALLPHLAKDEELDTVSSAGYALGYLGGGLLLALNLAFIQKPQWFGLSGADAGARLAFLTVGVWWVMFSLPLLFRVHEPPRRLEPDERPGQNALKVAFTRLGETFTSLKSFRHAFLLLAAFLLYNDGIATIIRMATIYGTEVGIDQGTLIAALLLTQIIGVPFAFAFGALAKRIGAKRAIFLSLLVYVGVSAVGYFMRTATHFFLLAVLVGMVQGGSQALSRSLFAAMVPRHKSSEFFAFFGVFEKVTAIFGPAVFAATVYLTGSSRSAVLSVVLFFVAGGLLLMKVDVDAGKRAAQEADRDARLPSPNGRGEG